MLVSSFVYLLVIVLTSASYSGVDLPAWAKQELNNNQAKTNTWAAKATAQEARRAAGNGKKLQLVLCADEDYVFSLNAGFPTATVLSSL